MSSASRLRIPLALALLCLAPLARAETTGPARLDIGRFRAAPDATGGFALSDPTGLAFGQYALALTLDDAVNPLVLQRDDGVRTSLVGNRFEGQLSGLVGLYGPLSVALELPVVFQAGSLAALPPSVQPLANGALAGAALGDLRLVPRFVVLDEKTRGVDLAVDAGLTLPTGTPGALTSDGGIAGEAFVTAARHVQDVRLLGEFGVRFRPNGKLIRLDVGSELALRLAAEYPLDQLLKTRLDALAEVDLGTLLSSPFGSPYASPAEWRVGARYCLMDHLALTGGLGGGLSAAYGTPLARFVASVGFDPRVCPAPNETTDQDHDGVMDAFDKCPAVVGDAAHQGCPAPKVEAALKSAPTDQDGDGVPDGIDQCPTVSGAKEFNGCPPPPPPDQDGDGIFDPDDKCPTVPGTLEFHGCPPPPPDSDNDGVPDSDDKCPTIPGVVELQGCPAPDRDKDGVADKDDVCPNVPGDAAHRGCPADDQDGDGIVDDRDRCPTKAGDDAHFGCPATDEDHDGVADVLDNCPTEKGSPAFHGCKVKQLAFITRDTVELADGEKIVFRGTAIDPRSEKLLEQVAAIIKSHDELGRLRVEGHTDNSGSVAELMKSSQDEADAVKAWLVGHGIPADRLDAVGYGDTRPIAPNLTKKGREANKRIELRILGKPAPVVVPLTVKPAAKPMPSPSLDLPLTLPMPPPAPTKPAPSSMPPMPPRAMPQVAPPPPPMPRPAAATPKPSTDLTALPPLDDEPALTLPDVAAPKPVNAKPATAPPPAANAKPAMAPPPAANAKPAMAPPPATAKPADQKKPAASKPDDLPLPPLDELPPLDDGQ